MPTRNSANFARICRELARFASTREVRKVLVELADHYESEGSLESAGDLPRGAGKDLE